MRIIFSFFAALLSTGCLAQVIGENNVSNNDAPYKLSTTSQLVIEAVVVRDKNGQAVAGLSSNDFTLVEDNLPQQIRICERQTMSQPSSPMVPLTNEKESISIYRKLSRSRIAPEDIETPKYQNRRLIALYFDMTALTSAEQMRALTAAKKFVRSQVTPDDMISIMRYEGGSVDVLQDFSQDRTRLLSILETLVVGEGQGFEASSNDASSADSGAAFGEDDSEFNIFNTDRQLSALQTAAKVLGKINETKVLVYFAGGLRLNGTDNQAQLHATIDEAIRSGVSFWPVDARGLTAEPPFGDASKSSPGGLSMYTGASAQATQTNFQRSQDILYSLASDTGGKAFFDNNDLTEGIRNAQASISDYYILGYYTSNRAADGRFRRIKLKVRNPEWKLEYRQGYYAYKQFAKFTVADRERQLEDALMTEDPVTDLSIATELNYFQLNHAEYFVPVSVKIPGRELALARKNGAKRTRIEFIGEVKDIYGGYTVTNFRDNIDLKLDDSTAAEFNRRPIAYDAGFTLLPGDYVIKILARDDETGRIGTFQTNFTIPNLSKITDRIAMSSVILSSQKVDINDVLYNSQKGKGLTNAIAANPLIRGGQKLIPSVTRVFRQKQRLSIFFEGYEENPSKSEPLVAYVSLFHEGSLQVETRPVLGDFIKTSKVTSVGFNFSVDLSDVPRGYYDCQVTILAPESHRTEFWRAQIFVIE